MKHIRDLYDEYGVADYYRLYGNIYRNPHEPIVRASVKEALDRWYLRLDHTLDLACGSGEVTLELMKTWPNPFTLKPQFFGADLYTYTAYEERTGLKAVKLSFDDIINCKLVTYFNTIFCSFALHLVEASKLPMLCWRLALSSPVLVIITPNKRPIIKEEWGFKLADAFTLDRVHTRLYRRTIKNL